MEIGISDLFVDFGDVPRDGGRDTLFDDFFRNIGQEPLSYFANVFVTEGEENIFNSNNVGAGELNPGDTFDLQLNFTPDRDGPLGPRTGILRVESTDYDVTFTLRNDTIYLIGNVVGESGVEYDMEADGRFYVTPNPVTGDNLSFHLAPAPGELGEIYLLTIVDPTGRQVYRRPGRFATEEGTMEHVDITGWPSGVYFIRVASPVANRARRTIVGN